VVSKEQVGIMSFLFFQFMYVTVKTLSISLPLSIDSIYHFELAIDLHFNYPPRTWV